MLTSHTLSFNTLRFEFSHSLQPLINNGAIMEEIRSAHKATPFYLLEYVTSTENFQIGDRKKIGGMMCITLSSSGSRISRRGAPTS